MSKKYAINANIHDQCKFEYDCVDTYNARLLAENDRLRAALDKIDLRTRIRPNGKAFDSEEALDAIGIMVSAALAETRGADEGTGKAGTKG